MKNIIAAILIATASTASAGLDENHEVLLRKLAEHEMGFPGAMTQVPGFDVVQRAKVDAYEQGYHKWVEYAQIAQRMMLNSYDVETGEFYDVSHNIFRYAQEEVNSYYTWTGADWSYVAMVTAWPMLFPEMDNMFDYASHLQFDYGARDARKYDRSLRQKVDQ